MKTNIIISLVLFVILILILYNLNYKDNIETFGILNKLNKKNNNKKKNKNKNNNRDKFSDTIGIRSSLNSLKSEKTGVTFDDLLTVTEGLDPDAISLTRMKEELNNYYNSFNKEKFNNNSKNTAESFEKFSLYKEKFFEIFK